MENLDEIAPDVFLQQHPLSMLGCKMGRMVTVIRLASGKLVIHSTAEFSAADVEAIRALGEPVALMEATCFHDTYAKAGREAFSEIPYFVPPGFPEAEALDATDLVSGCGSIPGDDADELEVIEIGGMPKIREHALYHRPSKTLIVADLIFNLPPDVGSWSQLFLRATAGIKEFPGMSRLFRFMIKDRSAFASSMETIAARDFDRLVVAHGDPIEHNAKAKLLGLLERFALAPRG